MSAGVCIMNKTAIALAADSAVTVGQHLAIHNSANKLFSISKYAPIGAVIYSKSELMRVPMETILKLYKAELEGKTFPKLEDYVSDFLSFLILKANVFHFDINESGYIKSVYKDLFIGLLGDYQGLIKKKLEDVKRELDSDELLAISNEAVNLTIKFIDSFPSLTEFSESKYISEKYKNEIKDYLAATYPWIPSQRMEELAMKTCQCFDKEFFREGYVGVAIAGFGDEEIFPHMVHLHVAGIVNNKVRYTKKEHVSISTDMSAAITPFAQTDVMETFLFGINNSLLNKVNTEIPAQIQNCLNSIDDSFFSEGKKQVIEKQLIETTDQIIKRVVEQAQKQYLFPITDAVSTLPIEELSLLAESMINITSIRRKVAIDDYVGTVGGPIDVAIISKVDGFIWMKRKHYFDREYNPQFFFNHYQTSGGN